MSGMLPFIMRINYDLINDQSIQNDRVYFIASPSHPHPILCCGITQLVNHDLSQHSASGLTLSTSPFSTPSVQEIRLTYMRYSSPSRILNSFLPLRRTLRSDSPEQTPLK